MLRSGGGLGAKRDRRDPGAGAGADPRTARRAVRGAAVAAGVAAAVAARLGLCAHRAFRRTLAGAERRRQSAAARRARRRLRRIRPCACRARRAAIPAAGGGPRVRRRRAGARAGGAGSSGAERRPVAGERLRVRPGGATRVAAHRDDGADDAAGRPAAGRIGVARSRRRAARLSSPEGAFALGADADEPWAYDNELPAHDVDVPSFRDRPCARDERGVPRLHRRRRLSGSRAVERRGLGLAGGGERRGSRSTGSRAAAGNCCGGASTSSSPCRRGSRCSTSVLGGGRIRALGREAPAERGGMGEGCAHAASSSTRPARSGSGRRPRSPAIPGSSLPVSGVLGGLLRRRVPGAARRLLDDRSARGAIELPQLGLPAAATDLLRHQVCA